MQNISDSGVFIKRFGDNAKVAMKPYAHRDDYYIAVLLTEETALVEIDFERIELTEGDILKISPWQVHSKPSGAVWQANGRMLAFSPELLSEPETRLIEESIAPYPFNPGKNIVADIDTLCSILERNEGKHSISVALASSIKQNSIFPTEVHREDTERLP